MGISVWVLFLGLGWLLGETLWSNPLVNCWVRAGSSLGQVPGLGPFMTISFAPCHKGGSVDSQSPIYK